MPKFESQPKPRVKFEDDEPEPVKKVEGPLLPKIGSNKPAKDPLGARKPEIK